MRTPNMICLVFFVLFSMVSVSYSACEGDINCSGTVDGSDLALFAADFGTTGCGTCDDVIGRIEELEDRIAQLEALLQHVTRIGNEIYVDGANLHIRSGSGYTDAPVNGLGNLIVGYNEERGSDDDRSGSHNIVVGIGHNFSSYGGLAVGYLNSITASYASVSGGLLNTASGDYSSVSGGIYNTASNYHSSVSGGWENTASGYHSSVSGGNGNNASGDYSSVSGGTDNTASGNYSSVTAGSINTASGEESSITGGRGNHAEGLRAAVHGGYGNHAWSWYSAVLGGQANYAGDPSDTTHETGRNATVVGGDVNRAYGNHSAVLGGNNNSSDTFGGTNVGDRTNVYLDNDATATH